MTSESACGPPTIATAFAELRWKMWGFGTSCGEGNGSMKGSGGGGKTTAEAKAVEANVGARGGGLDCEISERQSDR